MCMLRYVQNRYIYIIYVNEYKNINLFFFSLLLSLAMEKYSL